MNELLILEMPLADRLINCALDSKKIGPWAMPTSPKISSKFVHNLLRYTAKCQFTPYLLMVKNPGNDPGSVKNPDRQI